MESWALVPKRLIGFPTIDNAIRKLVKSLRTTDAPVRQPARDALLGVATEAELAANQERTATMSGLDLGLLWVGSIISKTKAGSIKDRRVLDEAVATT